MEFGLEQSTLEAVPETCSGSLAPPPSPIVALSAEPEAVDLLLEVDHLEWLLEHVDEKNYRRACLYLINCCSYLPEPDDTAVLQTAYQIFMKLKQYPDAIRLAMRMKRQTLVQQTFSAETEPLGKKQLAYILGQNVSLWLLALFLLGS